MLVGNRVNIVVSVAESLIVVVAVRVIIAGIGVVKVVGVLVERVLVWLEWRLLWGYGDIWGWWDFYRV